MLSAAGRLSDGLCANGRPAERTDDDEDSVRAITGAAERETDRSADVADRYDEWYGERVEDLSLEGGILDVVPLATESEA